MAGLLAPLVSAQKNQRTKSRRKTTAKYPANSKPIPATRPDVLSPEDAAAQTELGQLARALKDGGDPAYENLKAYAERQVADNWGARAALTLGYFAYSRARNEQAAEWLEKAQKDGLLKEYALFWRAQVERALGNNAAALADLQAIRRDYPDSANTEHIVEALSLTALTLGKAQAAAAALDAYPATPLKPGLLFQRAHAWQTAGALARAAKDYQAVYYRFPLSDEARSVSSILEPISKQLRGEYPRPTLEQQEARAQAFFDAHKWKDARSEFEKLANLLGKKSPSLMRQRAQLRSAQARVQPKGSPAPLSSLKIADPELDAERLYSLSQAWRTKKQPKEMFAALNQLAALYPQSRWNEDGLFSAGNVYWVALDRDRAADYYRRLAETFPTGKNVQTALWRIAWVAYLERKPEGVQLIESFVSSYPSSSYAVNALYWLGRAAERTGNFGLARSFFLKAVERFPETYFGLAAAARLEAIGREPVSPAGVVEKIPPAPQNHRMDEPIPAAAAARWARAEALRTIAFDSSAELELRAAFVATALPRFIFEAAQAAVDQGHYATGMALGRMAFPNLEARKKDDVPLALWRTIFPLPYESLVRQYAERNDLDPMLVAGLIRQESVFQHDAVSRANAIGLMQVLPKTGRLLAKRLNVRYARQKLFEPEYNLQLGTLYLSDLLKQFHSPEAALAAFNAGEDRIASWQAGCKCDEVAEVVESIPFTETREYIQIVLRNAQVYRMIYGGTKKTETAQQQP